MSVPSELNQIINMIDNNICSNIEDFGTTTHLCYNCKGLDVSISNHRYMGVNENLIIDDQDETSKYDLYPFDIDIDKNFLNAFQQINDAVIIIDSNQKVLFINHVAEKLTDFKFQEIYSNSISKIFCISCELTQKVFQLSFDKNNSENSDLCDTEKQVVLNSRHGKKHVIEYKTISIHDSGDKIKGTIIIFRDVTDKSRLAKALSWQINHDMLTGLLNRKAFEESIDEAISCDNLNSHQNILCHLNLDHFKVINETCGHVAGDEFLRQVSTILQKRVRKTDILARLGGDEFGLILYKCTREQAIQVLQAIREDVEKFSFVFNTNKFNISVSIGAVLLNSDNYGSSHLLNASISACNSAKKSGRNRIHTYYDNDLYLSSQRGEIGWINRIFKALNNDEFCLYGQSIVALNNENKFTDFTEILIRLHDENGCLIPPGEFIPPAEKHGIMHLIDRWVIRNLFSKLKTKNIQEEFLARQSANHFFSINLSGATLNDDQFLDFIEEQFRIFQISPKKICFEITETVAITNLNKTIELISKLRSLGCYFALDDFGSGMSSFGYLKHLPIDFLKIDGIFIREILTDNIDQEIAESINRIAHVIGIQTVAEYVESHEIFLRLQSIGIDFAQGFGIAKPKPLFQKVV